MTSCLCHFNVMHARLIFPFQLYLVCVLCACYSLLCKLTISLIKKIGFFFIVDLFFVLWLACSLHLYFFSLITESAIFKVLSMNSEIIFCFKSSIHLGAPSTVTAAIFFVIEFFFFFIVFTLISSHCIGFRVENFVEVFGNIGGWIIRRKSLKASKENWI